MNPFDDGMKAFKDLCTQWFSAPIILQDLWDLTIELGGSGVFKQIDSRTRQKKALMTSDGQPSKILNKKVCNYFSVGVESKIGIGFDRHRRRSQLQNKFVYINEGVKKNFFHSKIHVDKIITKMTECSNGPDTPRTIFDNTSETARRLQKCGSLIAVNIPSFASGLDVWHHAHRVGLVGPDLNGTSDMKQLLKAPQIMGDQKIEWVTFSGVASMGAEQLMEGHGRRLHQGSGPYLLEFAPDLDLDERVYFQIDGEFYQMTQPRRLRLSHYKTIRCLANGQRECFRLAEAHDD
eukprot:Blabericola_migrator_1__2328@NODE_164_length_12331_cov_134_122880_g142_i0_p7_GENE_NODE_164_length_12331_cov_134_122880_g142_i0NODE_164_length_12331_cov_134_122880_g142_i0_p7_ORF_typecomplete_len292_score37_25DAGK_acc/PF00609_19/7_2e27_NODE_164_length_12331_cov_134_122880_g142_i027913666